MLLRRRTLRARSDDAVEPADGARARSWTTFRARAYPIDGETCDADGYERTLRERFGAAAVVRPGRVRARAGRAHGVAVPGQARGRRDRAMGRARPGGRAGAVRPAGHDDRAGAVGGARSACSWSPGAAKREALARLLAGEDIPAALMAPGAAGDPGRRRRAGRRRAEPVSDPDADVQQAPDAVGDARGAGAPTRSIRSARRQIGDRPVNSDIAAPTANSATPLAAIAAITAAVPEPNRKGSERDRGAQREREERGDRRPPRRPELVRIEPQLLPRMGLERDLRVLHHDARRLLGEVLREPLALVDLGQLAASPPRGSSPARGPRCAGGARTARAGPASRRTRPRPSRTRRRAGRRCRRAGSPGCHRRLRRTP